MRAYLRDCLVVLYRTFCQPTAFVRETRRLPLRQQAFSIVKVIPVVLLLDVAAVAVLLALGRAAMGAPILWPSDVDIVPTGVAFGVAAGVVMGVALAAAGGLAGGVVMGVAMGVGMGVAMGLVGGVARGVVMGVAMGLAMGLPLGVARGVAGGVGMGVAMGLVGGVVTGLAGGVAGTVSCIVCYFRCEWYVVDAGATLWQLVRARRDAPRARDFFRRSPIYWREPIWLPVPRLRGFLQLIADQDYQAAVDECLFIISQRPTQGRAARRILVEVTLDRLARARSVNELAVAARDLGWVTPDATPLYAPLAMAVAPLQRLGAHAGQHLAATHPYLRRQALLRLCEEARDLALVYSTMAGWLAGSIVGIARGWERMAQERLEEMDRTEAALGLIRNPFVFGQPIEQTDTNLFVGRRDIVQ